MKKVNFFGMILVIFACLIVPKTGVSAPLHPAGLLWDSAEIIEANLLERSPLAYEQVLPSQVDISHLFPPPGNQGAQNSCVAWAVAYLRTKHEGILRDWDFSSNEKISAHEQILSHEKISAHENISSHEKITSQEKISANENIFADEKISAHEKIPHKNIFAHENISSHEKILSPAYIYNQINGGGDTGSSYSDALNLLIHQGVTTLASFPYNQFDFRAQPNVSQRGEAVDFRIGSWNTIRGVDEMRRFLHEKNGIVVGVNIFPGFDRISRENPVFDTILFGERHRGGHAVVLVGYCDEKQAFKFLNSWGISWGVDGFGWISYELLGDSRVNSRAWGGQPVGYIMNPEDSRTHENFFDFSVENNEATITRYFGPGGELAIPKNIGGYPVTSIGADAIIFRAREGHSPTPSRVEIPDGVVSIGARAFNYGLVWFRETMSLTEILIPESVTTIGSAAFSMSYFPASTAPQGMILPDITIYGAENSFAHEYANANLIPFAAIGNEPTQRSITFHLGGGTRTGGGALRQLVNYGDDAVPPIVSQTGHTFAGWNDDFTNVIDNRVVRALWTATPAFTVTFDPAGGTRTGGGQLTQSIPEGGNAVLPILAPHDEYVFLGWDGDHTNITSNRTITAIWVHVSDTRTVTFELAGGTRTGGGALFQRIAYGRDAVPPQVSRAHHAFDGWDGDYTNVTTDRTITALWTALPTFAVSFDSDSENEISLNGVTARGVMYGTRASEGGTVLVFIFLSGIAETEGTHTFGLESSVVEFEYHAWGWDSPEIDVWAGMNFNWGAPVNLVFSFEMPAHDVTDLRLIHTFTPENPPTGVENIARNFTAMLIFFFTSAGLWIYVIRRRFYCCDNCIVTARGI